MNGGVFLGLNGTIVKSHGSADATGISAAIKLAFKLARDGFTEGLAVLMLTVFAAGSLALQYPLGWLADRLDHDAVRRESLGDEPGEAIRAAVADGARDGGLEF